VDEQAAGRVVQGGVDLVPRWPVSAANN